MKVSVLIPYKSDSGGYRDINFYYVKQRYQTLMPDLELVISEDNSDPFNRSKAINRAAEKATGDLFILADSDIFFDIGLIDKIIAFAEISSWIVPFNRGYKLTPACTHEVTKTGVLGLPSSLLRNITVEKECNNIGAFMNVMSRQAFETIGGMDERFWGWGREDEAMVMALDTLIGSHFRINEPVFHLWHPSAEDSNPYLTRNDNLRNRYIQALGNTQAMKELISERIMYIAPKQPELR